MDTGDREPATNTATSPVASGPAIRVRVNGEERALPAGISVAGLLATLGAPERGVAVEVNRRVVRRAEHASTILAEGDRVEVVSFVGGG